MKKKPCRKCQQWPANRPNGLCYRCFREEQKAAAPNGATAEGGVPELAAGDGTLFEDMRHVRRFPASRDRTEGQRDARRWKQQDFKGFMTRLADLEKAALAGQAKAPGAPPPAVPERDAGSERARKLLREGIARDEAEQARRDAELAGQPGAAERGRARQEELRAALWREREAMLACTGLFDARRDALTENDCFMVELHITFHQHLRARALELAARPDPGNVIDSLERALKSTAEREAKWREGIAELEVKAA
jgi:hypothetical protein